MTAWTAGLVHHSDRGVQYTAIRYSDRLDEARRGDAYRAAINQS